MSPNTLQRERDNQPRLGLLSVMRRPHGQSCFAESVASFCSLSAVALMGSLLPWLLFSGGGRGFSASVYFSVSTKAY